MGEIAKEAIHGVFGDRPGVDLILFGIILVLILALAPRGLVGILERVWIRLKARGDA